MEEKLKNNIKIYNDLYRKGTPEVSDIVYDNLLDELAKLIPADEFEEFRESLFEQSGDVKHEFVMGSLRKYKYEDGSVNKWYSFRTGHKMHLSAKLDGCSQSLVYRNGALVESATRGDGEYGVSQLSKIRHVVPTKLTGKYVNFSGTIKGEVTLINDTFEDAKRISGTDYKNLRNATSGILNSDNVSADLSKCLRFYAYRIMGSTDTLVCQFKMLKEMGFEVPISKYISHKDCGDDLNEYLKELYLEFKDQSPCDIDGVVVYQEKCEYENVKLPKNSIAFKMNIPHKSKVAGVDLDISMYGALKGVLLIEPVDINGSTIQRATLHNYDYIEKYDPHYGDEVLLQKSGEIIPYVLHVKRLPTSGARVEIPTICPSCGTTLVRKGVDMVCTNIYDCPRQKLLKVEAFVKRLGVKGTSEKSLLKYGITDFESLLDWMPNDNSKGEVKFYEELLDKMFNVSPETLYMSLPFDGIGGTLIGKLLETYTLEDVALCNFKHLPEGVGDKTVSNLKMYSMINKEIVDTITEDCRYNYDPDSEGFNSVKSDVLNGKSFCVTGKLPKLGRGEIHRLVEVNGGIVKSGVSKGLDYLITNTPDSGSSKNQKAQKFGTTLITEEQFIEMVGDQGVTTMEEVMASNVDPIGDDLFAEFE